MTSGELAERAGLPHARARALVAAVPVWAWLAALVAVSSVVRFLLARRLPAPWIFVDELIYGELAKSFAESGTFAVREVSAGGAYGFVYPLLIAPAYAVFERVPEAYAAAKATNAVLMSLAAVPTYLLARRLLGRGLSFLAAVLAVAIPSMVYTGTLMTENAFYPAFLLAALGIVLALERPTVVRQLGAVALAGLAFLVRVQAVALLAALVTAIVLVALLEREESGRRLRARALLRGLDRFRATWLALAAGAAVLALVQLARGRSPADLLGAYEAARSQDYSLATVSRWVLYHVAELDLYLGVLPFAAFVLLAALALGRAEASRPLRAYAAASISLVVWTTVLVAAFASQPSVWRVEERNLFYVAPLFLIALLAWIERGLPRPWPAAAVAAVVAVGLPGTLPYGELITTSAISDTLALLPLWNLQDSLVTGPQVPAVVLLAAIVGGLLFLLVPSRYALLAPALVLLYFAGAHRAVEQRIEHTSVGSLFSGIRVEREWIDEAVGADAEVVAIWSGNATRYAIWQNEFFNRSVGRVYHLAEPLPGTLPETPAAIDEETGLLRDEAGRPVRARYALSDGSVVLDGEPVAWDPQVGMVVYRVDGPLVSTTRIAGLYPNDTWSGRELTYTRLDCRGGRLTVSLTSDPGLFSSPQTVVASAAGRQLARTTVAPTAVDQELAVPLRPQDGRCEVRFTVAPTAVPAEVVGSGDTRELGIHFTSFRYEPPR